MLMAFSLNWLSFLFFVAIEQHIHIEKLTHPSMIESVLLLSSLKILDIPNFYHVAQRLLFIFPNQELTR